MRTLKRVLAAVAVVLVLTVIWGFGVEPRIIDSEEEIGTVPGLPGDWVGQRIAVVADYQVGMWGSNTSTMRRITARLVEDPPAAVLLAGDFIYKAGDDPLDEITLVQEIIEPLTAAGIPTFAVLGNHDYSLNRKDGEKDVRMAAAVAASLESIGVTVLRNEAVPVEVGGAGAGDGGPLYLVGVDSEWAEEARPEVALAGVPAGAPRIVFMHNPSSFPEIPAGAAPLTIAAHTHGGQIRIPATPAWSWLGIVARGEAHADGWIEEGYGRPGNRLYVNRGVGFSTIPIRINCPPEVTYFRLEAPA